MFSKYKRSKILNIVGIVALVIYGFFMAQTIIVLCLKAYAQMGFLDKTDLSSTLLQFNAAFLAYMLSLIIILGLYSAIKNSTKGLTKLLAIQKPPNIMSVLHVLLGYGAYLCLTIILGVLAQILIPSFDTNEQQQVGFEHLNSMFEYVMAFAALVVLAPIVEEAVFRGFMFSKIRQNASFVVTALIVSATFGLVHLQWNVAVDVFALSLVLCFLREKTSSIWAGVGVHMLKNLLAFSVLFLHLDISALINQLFY